MARNYVRIIRKRKSTAQMFMAWGNLFTLLTRFAARPQIEANLNAMQEARYQEIQARTQVAEMRKQKLSNELVIQDMKIEMLKAELKRRGIGEGDFAPPSDYNP